jgi:hypothetical protein
MEGPSSKYGVSRRGYMTRKRLYFGAATILFLFSSLSLQAKPTGDQVSEAICDFNLPQVQKYVAQGGESTIR